MKNIGRTRILTLLTLIIFLGVAIMSFFVTDYVANYYDKLGRKVPRWIYYSQFAVLGLAFMKFNEAFSDEKHKKTNDNIRKR